MTDTQSADARGTIAATLSEKTSHPNHFAPAVRMVKAADFDRVFKQNARSRDQQFIVLARLNHLPYARLGLAVSRKAAGDAVPRNRLKRLIRESFRCRRARLPAIDCVVMAKPGAAKQNSSILLKSLDQHWTRLAKLCATSS